ncbi:hypothetical protein ACLOJK_001585 [Asimina triloba]
MEIMTNKDMPTPFLGDFNGLSSVHRLFWATVELLDNDWPRLHPALPIRLLARGAAALQSGLPRMSRLDVEYTRSSPFKPAFSANLRTPSFLLVRHFGDCVDGIDLSRGRMRHSLLRLPRVRKTSHHHLRKRLSLETRPIS